jgi:hypothetical protein
MESGGVIAWGIVPSDPKVFGWETVESLTNRYLEIRKTVTEHVEREIFDGQSLITPSCGIQLGTEGEAVAIMEAAAAIAERVHEVIR